MKTFLKSLFGFMGDNCRVSTNLWMSMTYLVIWCMWRPAKASNCDAPCCTNSIYLQFSGWRLVLKAGTYIDMAISILYDQTFWNIWNPLKPIGSACPSCWSSLLSVPLRIRVRMSPEFAHTDQGLSTLCIHTLPELWVEGDSQNPFEYQ